MTIFSCFTGSVNAAETSTITFAPSAEVVDPDQPFTVSISIDPSVPINGVQFDLQFTPSLVSATEVTEGNLLSQNGANTIFNRGTINNDAGTVTNVYGFILGATSVSSPGVFADIGLTAGSTTGTATLSLSNVIISDADANAVPYTISTSDGSGSININVGPDNTAPTANPYDTNQDYIIQIGEMLNAISDWKTGNLPMGDMMTIIGYWKSGQPYC
ncbi:MAG: hypothetical protein JXA98_05740 [Methanosarcinaceae archaeon]|nr:hypothetical protein [Methanosarcinaceae archaeon]